MHRRFLQLAAVGLPFLGGTAFAFGGWAVITVDELPQTISVGEPATIAFTVRQHGMRLMDDLSPTLVAVSEQNGEPKSLTSRAAPGGAEGRYVAQLTVPRSGSWAITINSGFLNNRVTLVPIRAVAAGDARAPEPQVERGRRLFVAKGCVGCHVHGAVAGYQSFKIGPDLTPKRYQAEYLAKVLADPTIVRQPGKTSGMPNLSLRAAEIASLVAFINADRQVSTR